MFYIRLMRLAWMILNKILNHKKETDEIDESRKKEELLKNPYKNRNLPLENVIGAYKRGFYAAALGATDKLMVEDKPTAEYCFYRGEILLHMGKMKEAEPLLLQCLELDADKSIAMQAQTSLGNLMLALGRCDEALANYQLSLKIEPNRSATHRAMAEAYLVKGDPTEALRLARLAVGAQTEAESQNRFLGERLATLAWALAANEAAAEDVAALVKKAVESVGNEVVSSTAQVHTQAGAAFAAIGDNESCTHHFGKAAAADLNGLWGKRAKAMLSGVKV